MAYDTGKATDILTKMRQTDAYEQALFREMLARFWTEHFTSGSFCGLCGNSGVIDTRPTARTPRGQANVGIVAKCICPNGMALRDAERAADASMRGGGK